jgi:hypothetical protein
MSKPTSLPASAWRNRQGGLYSVGELRQWQHLQEVPQYQNLLTADLAQGICTGFDDCALTPVPGAPSYTLSNLEADALQAVTPDWVENLKAVFYWGGLILAWLAPVGLFLVARNPARRHPESNPGVFPLNIHTSSVNTPTMTPTVVTTDLRSTSNTGPTQQLLGCKDVGAAVAVRAVKVVPPGVSKRAQSIPNSSLA